MSPELEIAAPPVVALVAARNEADRVGATVAALHEALPGVEVIVADDASTDATAEVASAHGARVVSQESSIGKGGNMTAAASTVIDRAREPVAPVFLLCDGDLGDSAGSLASLVDVVRGHEADLAIAAFRRRAGGGFGVALRYAHRAIRDLCGYDAGAPISGQRALSPAAMRASFPFAARYGMEIGITVDVVRAGFRVAEIELDLEHRATGRSLGGFVHRARQLRDFARVRAARRQVRDAR